jgi:DNA-binding PadR family transcriptional regulator
MTGWLGTRVAGELATAGKHGKTAADITGTVPTATHGQVYAALVALEKAGLAAHTEPAEGRPWRWELPANNGKG